MRPPLRKFSSAQELGSVTTRLSLTSVAHGWNVQAWGVLCRSPLLYPASFGGDHMLQGALLAELQSALPA